MGARSRSLILALWLAVIPSVPPNSTRALTTPLGFSPSSAPKGATTKLVNIIRASLPVIASLFGWFSITSSTLSASSATDDLLLLQTASPPARSSLLSMVSDCLRRTTTSFVDTAPANRQSRPKPNPCFLLERQAPSPPLDPSASSRMQVHEPVTDGKVYPVVSSRCKRWPWKSSTPISRLSRMWMHLRIEKTSAHFPKNFLKSDNHFRNRLTCFDLWAPPLLDRPSIR